MRVVALISGGKDSCYNMVQCVAAGHEIVALANLRPESRDELDSYMYQTVGHQGVELYAEAMGLPLFRQNTSGVALSQGQQYVPTPDDEVEDLYQLLKSVQDKVSVDAVAVGAILSDYQRIRVENVCSRLGLTALAYLWRRDQEELLQEMIDCQVNAIVIKVAALGLHPLKHLGLSLVELQPHILQMKEKYGLNVCGEGGEYETFTLDCPLFTKTIVIDDVATVIHSDDAIAPVGFLNFNKFHLVDKEDIGSSMVDRLTGLPIRTWRELITDIDEDYSPLPPSSQDSEDYIAYEEDEEIIVDEEDREEELEYNASCSTTDDSGWTWVGGIMGRGPDCSVAVKDALEQLQNIVPVCEIVAVFLYLKDMTQYSEINTEYSNVFGRVNPPVRVCVEAPLSSMYPVLVEGIAFSSDREEGGISRRTMHVQGISHWAPANIGPYSQAVKVGDITYIAGQIALIPGTMQLVGGGIRRQCRLSLRHVGRIVHAMDPGTQLRDVVQGICYVTNASYIPEARREWERRTNNAIVDYVVLPSLPRGALIEWQVWVHKHNNRFEYEETGCCIDQYRVSIRRRWNYENNVSAVVCYVSTGTSNPAATSLSESCVSSSDELSPTSPSGMADSDLSEIVDYVVSKLLWQTSIPKPVCSLRVYYKIGVAPQPRRLRAALANGGRECGATLVSTIVPARSLQGPQTFLSICGVRHN